LSRRMRSHGHGTLDGGAIERSGVGDESTRANDPIDVT